MNHMKSIWVGIHPQRESTRILVMSGAAETLLKARLSPWPSSRLALSALLEAIALWQGRPVRAALVADASGGPCESSLFRDSFPDFGNGIHYTLEYVSVLRPPRRREGLGGMGDFRDLRQMRLFDLSR
jgi:hypothetical protein